MSRRNLEAFFRARSIAFIDVREAAASVLPEPLVECDQHEELGVFDYVLYGTECNALVLVRPRSQWLNNDAWRMGHWERLFGVGFKAVFAAFRTHPEFWDIAGEPVDIEVILRNPPCAIKMAGRIEAPLYPVSARANAPTFEPEHGELFPTQLRLF